MLGVWVCVCVWVKHSTHAKSVNELFLLLSYFDIYMLWQTLAADTTTSARASSDITELHMQPMSKENEKWHRNIVLSLCYTL